MSLIGSASDCVGDSVANLTSLASLGTRNDSTTKASQSSR